jgi:pimeloyl-ACP methyl ester carboxylesterase
VSGDERKLRVGGLNLHVRTVGGGQGTPLLLINGLGAHTAMWAPLERQLSGRRLISFDAPGLGHSGPAWPPPGIGVSADLIALLLDELDLPVVDVLGYSYGGAVAQQFAHAHANRVRRLVLAATLPGWGAVLGQTRSMALAWNPLRYMSRRYYERTIGTLAGGQARTNASFRQAHMTDRLSRPPRWSAYYGQVAALTAWSSLPWLQGISAPTLVVTGDDDPLVPMANSYLLARRIKKARLFVAPGEGHLLLFDDNSAAHAQIQDFLSAPALEDASSWSGATRVVDAQVAEVLEDAGSGPWPWGALSALSRRRVSEAGSVS